MEWVDGEKGPWVKKKGGKENDKESSGSIGGSSIVEEKDGRAAAGGDGDDREEALRMLSIGLQCSVRQVLRTGYFHAGIRSACVVWWYNYFESICLSFGFICSLHRCFGAPLSHLSIACAFLLVPPSVFDAHLWAFRPALGQFAAHPRGGIVLSGLRDDGGRAFENPLRVSGAHLGLAVSRLEPGGRDAD